jgi:hypothetical protein
MIVVIIGPTDIILFEILYQYLFEHKNPPKPSIDIKFDLLACRYLSEHFKSIEMKKLIQFPAFRVELYQIKFYLILIMLTSSLSSCFQKFYSTNTVTETKTDTLKKLSDEKKVFIVHAPDAVFVMKHMTVNDETVSGDSVTLNPLYEKYLNPRVDSPNRIVSHQKDLVLNQVHIYTHGLVRENGKMSMGIEQIYRLDVYKMDKEATSKSTTISIVGISVVVGAIIAAVAIAASNMTFGGGLGN